MVATGQLRVVRRLPGAVWHCARRLCHPAPHTQIKRAMVFKPDRGSPGKRCSMNGEQLNGEHMTGRSHSKPRRIPTLEVVAEHAGVSRATASRVVNGSPRVSPEAHAAVTKAISALGYVPNRAARSLVTRRTDTLVLIVHERPDTVFEDPFFSNVLRGVNAALSTTEMQ